MPPTPTTPPAEALDEPLVLRSGLALPNRLVKAAMTEGLADQDGDPSRWHDRLYRRWGASGLGAMVTGNVMVDRRYLERARNVVVDPLTDDGALRRWAAACSEVPTVVQLNHPGRQCNRLSAWRPVAPSAGDNVHLLGMFGRPRALSTAEVDDVRDRFVDASRVGWYRLQMELVARGHRPWRRVPATVAAGDYALRGLAIQAAQAPRRHRLLRRLQSARP